MRIAAGMCVALALVAGVGQTRDVSSAQTPASGDGVNSSVLVELEGIHATLDRLLASSENVEKIQRSALALQQVQVYDSRLRALRSEEAQLASRESLARQQVAAYDGSARALGAGVGPNGLPLPAGESGEDAIAQPSVAAQEGVAIATRTVDQIHERRQALQREIAALQSSIARLEALVDAAIGGR